MNNGNNYGPHHEQVQQGDSPHMGTPPPPPSPPDVMPSHRQAGYMPPLASLSSNVWVAFTQGNIFGAIKAGVNLLWVFFLVPHVFIHWDHLILWGRFEFGLFETIFSTIIAALIFSLAGMLTSKRTGRIGSALVACLWVLLWSEISSIIFSLINLFLRPPFTRAYLMSRGFLLGVYLPGLLGGLLITGVVLLIFGTLGGLVGKSLASNSQPH